MPLWVACYASVTVTPSGSLRPRHLMQCTSANERATVRAVVRWMEEHRDELERDADLARLSETAGPTTRAQLGTEVLTPARLEATSSFSSLAAFVEDFRRRLDDIIVARGVDAPGSAFELIVTRLEADVPARAPHRLVLRCQASPPP